MALRPNILADAAFDVAFEASILLQDADINLFGFTHIERHNNMSTVQEILISCLLIKPIIR
jgi:hypothetical protein